LAEDQPFPVPEGTPAAGSGKPEPSVAPAPVDEPEQAPSELAEGRVRLAEDRLTEVLDAYRKLKGENEAFRDRTTRNLERRFDQRHESLLLKFIDILDNMDRALEAAQTAYADPSLLEGLILVRTQLLQTLQDEGLERIPVLGLPFDPHVSEAVGTEEVGDPDQSGVVLKELMRGYRLNGRVARASRVVMGEYRAGDDAPADAPPAAEEEPAVEEAAEEAVEEAVEEAAAPPASDEPGEDGELTLEQIIARTENPAPSKPRRPRPAKG
jgi:molecular chaperone GrpE